MIDWRMTAIASAALALVAVPAHAQDTGGQTRGQQQQATDRQGGQMQTGQQDGQMRPGQQAERMQPGQQDGQMQPGQTTVLLDIEGFSQELYERGFRQGYIRGVADARGRFLRELAEYNRRTGQNVADDVASPAAGLVTGAMSTDPQAGGEMDQGAIVVLPPGMTPEMFLERLQAMNDAAQDSGARPGQRFTDSMATGERDETAAGAADEQRRQQAEAGGDRQRQTGGTQGETGGGTTGTSQ